MNEVAPFIDAVFQQLGVTDEAENRSCRDVSLGKQLAAFLVHLRRFGTCFGVDLALASRE